MCLLASSPGETVHMSYLTNSYLSSKIKASGRFSCEPLYDAPKRSNLSKVHIDKMGNPGLEFKSSFSIISALLITLPGRIMKDHLMFFFAMKDLEMGNKILGLLSLECRALLSIIKVGLSNFIGL